MPVGCPKPNFETQRPNSLVAELLADHDRADVRGLGEDVGDAQRPVADRVRLADRPVGDLDLGRHVEGRLGLDEAVLERAGDRERLEGRARLVGEAGRHVRELVGVGAGEVVGVDRRPARHREDVAVGRVHDDRRRVLGHVLVADVAEHLLGVGLDPAVDRELDVVAGGGAGDDVAVDLLAERVLGDRDLAVGAREDVVLGLLDAEQPLALVADGADQPAARPCSCGIDAARVREGFRSRRGRASRRGRR